MSAKPATVPTWATTATGIARTVDPGGTVRGDGWNVDDRPPAGWWNFIWHSVGLWCQYLSDQVFTGDVTVSAGELRLPNAPDVKHGLRTDIYDASYFVNTLNGTFNINSFDVAAGSFGEGLCPLTVSIGQRIISIRVIAETDNGVATDINARLTKCVAVVGDAGSTKTDLVGPVNLASGVADINQITLTPGAPETVIAGRSYGVRVNFQNTGGGAGKRVYRVEVDIDRNP